MESSLQYCSFAWGQTAFVLGVQLGKEGVNVGWHLYNNARKSPLIGSVLKLRADNSMNTL